MLKIRDIVSGRVQTAHVPRLRFYAHSQLNVTADVNQGRILACFQSRAISNYWYCSREQKDDRSLLVLVDWAGFEVEERTWKPFTDVVEAAPGFLTKKLHMLRVSRAVAARITREFGIQL